MLWVYGHYKYFNSSSAKTDFMGQKGLSAINCLSVVNFGVHIKSNDSSYVGMCCLTMVVNTRC